MPRILGALAPVIRPARVLGAYQSGAELCEVSHHVHLSPRVDDQGARPSCVGQAFGNAIRIARSLAGLPREEIDGDSIWVRGRKMYNGGRLSGGLTLLQGMHAAKALDLIPSCVTCVRVALEKSAICEALKRGPIVVANSVHPGWDNLHRDNQAVDESQPFSQGNEGHATCVFALDQHNGRWMTRHENSWGEKGVVAMTIEHFLATALDEPVLLATTKGHP
jgi:hypothetical protein